MVSSAQIGDTPPGHRTDALAIHIYADAETTGLLTGELAAD